MLLQVGNEAVQSSSHLCLVKSWDVPLLPSLLCGAKEKRKQRNTIFSAVFSARRHSFLLRLQS